MNSKSDGTVRALRQLARQEPFDGISEQQPQPDTERPPTGSAVQQAAEEAIERSFADTPTRPLNTTHSSGLAGMMMAHERLLKEKAADIRAKIADLEAEYTDIMLAASSITAAMEKMKAGRE